MGQSARRNGVTRPRARSVSSAEHRRLKQELQRQAGMTRLLAALSCAVTEAPSSEGAMTACLELICKHGGWAVGRLGIFSDHLENPAVPERSYWKMLAPGRYEEFTRASEDDRFYRPHGSFISAMLREKRPVWISPLWSVSGGRMAIALAQGLRCGFVFPVTLGDRIVAFLEFFATDARPPDALLLENIIGVSAQLSRLIERERAETALRESQRLLTLVTHNLPAMIVYFDRDLVCRFANEAYCQAHKVKLDEVLGRTLLEITGEETYRLISPSLERTRSGQPAVLQHIKRIAGGELRYFHVHRVPDMSDGGEFRGYYGMLLDVTEQTLAEQALRQSDERFRALIETIPHLVWSARVDGVTDYYNKRLLDYVGKTHDEMYGFTWTDVLHPDDQERAMAAWMQAYRSATEYNCEFRILRAVDGEYRWHLSRGVRYCMNGMERWFGTCTDVHERRLAEEALARSEERFYAIFHSSPIGISVGNNDDGRFIEVNDRFLALCGYERSEVLGRTSLELGLWIDTDQRAELHRRLKQGLPVQNVEVKLRRKSGETAITLFSLQLVQLRNGAVRYAMYAEITQRRLAEDMLRQREQELRRALAEREELSRDLHDNTIQLIYSVGLGLEHVQQLIPEESKEAQRKLSDAVLYLNNAIQHLRSHITVTPGTLVDAAQLRDELEGLTRMVHSTHGVQFRLTTDPTALLRTPPEAVNDMIGIVREAVSNSLRHSAADGGSITLQEHGDCVRLAVCDSGVGFEVERAEQTGQGLSNIRARAARLHAALEISSRPGMGSRISIDVPAVKAAEQAE